MLALFSNHRTVGLSNFGTNFFIYLKIIAGVVLKHFCKRRYHQLSYRHPLKSDITSDRTTADDVDFIFW